jgi:hypothetical protein
MQTWPAGVCGKRKRSRRRRRWHVLSGRLRARSNGLSCLARGRRLALPVRAMGQWHLLYCTPLWTRSAILEATSQALTQITSCARTMCSARILCSARNKSRICQRHLCRRIVRSRSTPASRRNRLLQRQPRFQQARIRPRSSCSQPRQSRTSLAAMSSRCTWLWRTHNLHSLNRRTYNRQSLNRRTYNRQSLNRRTYNLQSQNQPSQYSSSLK